MDERKALIGVLAGGSMLAGIALGAAFSAGSGVNAATTPITSANTRADASASPGVFVSNEDPAHEAVDLACEAVEHHGLEAPDRVLADDRPWPHQLHRAQRSRSARAPSVIVQRTRASGSISREAPHRQLTRTRNIPKQSSSVLIWVSARTCEWGGGLSPCVHAVLPCAQHWIA